MARLHWTDAHALGIKTIDEQHRRFVERLAALLESGEAAAAPGAPAAPEEQFERLCAHALEHFHVEEGYMQAFGYPELPEHQAEHQGFVERMRGFEAACAAQGPAAVTAQMLDYLLDWRERHMLDADRRLGLYLADCLR